MCFRIHQDHPTIKTARKDIVCYKRFSRDFYKTNKIFKSPYYDFKYEPGERYYEDNFVNKTTSAINLNWTELGTGLHSYSSLQEAKWSVYDSEILVRCVIPEGAKYMYNPDRHEYISDYLIIGKKPI